MARLLDENKVITAPPPEERGFALHPTFTNTWFYLVLACFFSSASSQAFVLTGEGHLGLEAQFRSKPTTQDGEDSLRGIRHNFRLGLEGVISDKASFFTELRITENLRDAYLGSDGVSRECQNENSPRCANRSQDPAEPGYDAYKPVLTELYAQVALEYCILKAGRRARNWGLGLLYDDGKKPFDTDRSVFDGVSCNLNLDKMQNLGFEVGYDFLRETNPDLAGTSPIANTGVTSKDDDLHQLFVSMTVDDRKKKADSFFRKNIGIYFAYIFGGDFDTKLSVADVYTDLYIGGVRWQNEVVFRFGDSANPQFSRYGSSDAGSNDADVSALGLGGEVSYTIAEKGSYDGPKELERGSFQSHGVKAVYALASGDKDGYGAAASRDDEAEAMYLHRNYKPAMLLFNGPSALDGLNKDGIYNADQVTNAYLFGLGYEYKNLKIGTFGLTVLGAQLQEDATAAAKAAASSTTPVFGFGGKDLGFEIDLSYTRKMGKYANVGVEVGYLLPGDAWELYNGSEPEEVFGVEAGVQFHF